MPIPTEAQTQEMLEKKMSPFKKQMEQLSIKVGALGKEEQQLRSSLKQQMDQVYQKGNEAYLEFGFANSQTATGLSILYRNRYHIDRKKLEAIAAQLPPNQQASRLGKSLKLFLHGNLVQVGGMFHDFEVQELNGRSFRFSSLLGKPILLTFWGTGCKGARGRNRWLADHYELLETRLTLVNFCLEEDRGNWSRASVEGGIHWHNLSDLEGEFSTIKTCYDFQGIPTAFLIDKDGIVLAKEREEGFDYDLLTSIESLLDKTSIQL